MSNPHSPHFDVDSKKKIILRSTPWLPTHNSYIKSSVVTSTNLHWDSIHVMCISQSYPKFWMEKLNSCAHDKVVVNDWIQQGKCLADLFSDQPTKKKKNIYFPVDVIFVFISMLSDVCLHSWHHVWLDTIKMALTLETPSPDIYERLYYSLQIVET